MKKLLILLIAVITYGSINAQVYDVKEVGNKFEEFITKTTVKTIVKNEYCLHNSDTLDCITIEEQGSPKRWYYFYDIQAPNKRRREIFPGIYCELCAYKVVELSTYEKYASLTEIPTELHYAIINSYYFSNDCSTTPIATESSLEDVNGNHTSYYCKDEMESLLELLP